MRPIKFSIDLRSKFIWIGLISVTIILSSFKVFAVIMWGRTGSPGETTCIACHASFPLNSGGGNIQISTSPALAGNQYMPGLTYTVNITVAQPPDSMFSCDVEIIDSLGNNAGTIVNTSLYTQLHTYAFNGRVNVFGSGTNPGSFTFTFNWTAPLSGEVNFYFTGVQPNNDGTFNGDHVYADSLVNIKPYSAAGIMNFLIKEKINAYPNPTSNTLFISIEENKFENSEIEITNSLGQIVLKSPYKTEINVSSLSTGFYYLKITSSGQQVYFSKFTKE